MPTLVQQHPQAYGFFMNRRELLELWEETHGTLEAHPDWREFFLRRDEVSEILEFDDSEIRRAVSVHPKLDMILQKLELNARYSGAKKQPKRVPYGTLGRKEIVTSVGEWNWGPKRNSGSSK